MIEFEMAPAVAEFVAAHNRLCHHYRESRLAFTLDGKLVGDLAEVIAVDLFGLRFPDRRTPGVDAIAADGRSVQVKATGLPHMGPAFSFGEGRADHLIFLRLDFARASGVIAYNGPEAPIRRYLPPTFKTKRVLLRHMLAEAALVPETDRLLRVR